MGLNFKFRFRAIVLRDCYELQFSGEELENTSSVAPRHLPLKGKANAKRNCLKICSREKDFTAIVKDAPQLNQSLPLEGKVARSDG